MENKQSQLDRYFQLAAQQPVEFSFEETRERFLTSTNSYVSDGSGAGLPRWVSIKVLGGIVAIGALLWFIFQPPSRLEMKSPEVPQMVLPVLDKDSAKSEQLMPGDSLLTDTKIPTQTTSRTIGESAVNLSVEIPEIEQRSAQKESDLIQQKVPETGAIPDDTSVSRTYDSVYVFPQLTPEEVEKNHAYKKDMMKDLVRFRNPSKHSVTENIQTKHYANIPAGAMEWEGDTIRFEEFYLQVTEVTNLEYRTFLFDLLIQNRKEEFMFAKPDQQLWHLEFAQFGEPMQAQYFSHPAYNDYPVVNVSRAGAQLYCQWLNEERAKLFPNQKLTPIRLPSEKEWIYGASSGGKQFPYPWDGPYYRNAKGCYLANFKPGTDTVPRCEDALNNLDGVYGDNLKISDYTADGGLYMVPVMSYAPNLFGLYCMSGNVAEMVTYSGESPEEGTKGGGWASEGAEIQINGKDPYRGLTTGSPNVGFRVLVPGTQ